jgi:hypothetical protein
VDAVAMISQRRALIHAARCGVEWIGDISLDDVKPTSLDKARNGMVERALMGDEAGVVDGVFWCDADVVLPFDAIAQLVSHQKDFVTGMYYQRYPPHFPIVGYFDAAEQGARWLTHWTPEAVLPVDLCGFGCVWTSMALLRALERPWFAFGELSEDLTFCRQARRRGFQLYVDTRVQCEHLGYRQQVTEEMFRDTWALWREQGKVAC